MQDILASFSSKYGLSKAEVMTEIESVLAARLSLWYRLEVMVFFREDMRLEAVAYNDAGGVILQKPVDLLKMKGQKTLQRHLENSLEKAAVLKQAGVTNPSKENCSGGRSPPSIRNTIFTSKQR